SAPATLAPGSQSGRSQTVNNPFASSGMPAGLPTSDVPGEPPSDNAPLNYPDAHAAGEENAGNHSGNAPKPSSNSSRVGSEASPSWVLPDAPLPRDRGDRSLAQANTGLMPPRRAAAARSIDNAQPGAIPAKQQAQEKLSAARQALASGDIDLAE